jgi:hypothetical protein
MEDSIPFRRLWGAVVIQAFRDLKDRDSIIRQRARNWIDDPAPVGEGGFKWICTCLDLDSDGLRGMSLSRDGINKIIYGQTQKGGKR